jgi:thioredoxin 1
VLKNERPVVVDFWATWCGPCKMVAPEMEKLAEKYAGAVDVVKVDVDANPRLSQTFNIMSIPTIAFFRPGQQPMGVIGFRPLEQLEQQFGLNDFVAAKAD